MKQNIYIILIAALLSISIFANAQEVQVQSAQGQRYNQKDFTQEFIYDLKIDGSNTIVGSIIQENNSVDKEWCAYLQITALDQDRRILQVFTTAPNKLEPKGNNINATVFTQNVSWELNDKCFSLDFECVTSCKPSTDK
jgi:hypothetical protein